MSPPPSVIVIGAGVIGCACAHALSSSGASVTVFDNRAVGQGASQASAGVLAPYIEGHESGPLRELGRRSLDSYDAFIADIIASSGSGLQYTRSGTLEIALESDHADRLRAVAARLGQEGVEARWLEPEQLREVEPVVGNGARGALLIPMHGFVSVPVLTSALAVAAMRYGTRFILDTRVQSISSSGDGRVSVVTGQGTSIADRVVLAAGSWVGQIEIDGVEALGVKPVRGQLLHLSWPSTQSLRHVLWGSDCYLVPWSNGRVLVGATVEDVGFDERATAAGVRDLLEAGCSLVPHLWQASFTEVRVGLRPASADGLPIIGESAGVPGLIYATGHYRNGVLLAPLTAELVRKLVIGDDRSDPALQVVAPGRFGVL